MTQAVEPQCGLGRESRPESAADIPTDYIGCV
jgi:hypothetical protein